MKILHLASEYASPGLPSRVFGLGRFVHGLARAQASQGDEVHVLTNSHGGQEDGVERDGVWMHRIAFPNPPRPSDGHGEVLQWNHGVVARLLDRRQAFAHVDLVVGHDWLTAPAAREAAQLLDRPLAVVVHDEVVGKHAGVLGPEQTFAHALEALATHDANLVIANSDYIARQVVRHYGVEPSRVTVVHGGVDASFEASVPQAQQAQFRSCLAGGEEVLVAYVGRLDPEKGLGTLAEAISRVASRTHQVRFLIAGTGRCQEALRQQLGGLARLVGYVRGESLVRLYRAADIVVVPSTYEPFGLVALEAMLCRAPVVVADSGGLPEIVRNGRDGVVVPPGDGEALAEAILRLASDREARDTLGEAGRRRAVTSFDWGVIAKRTREAYQRVLGAAPRVVQTPPPRIATPITSAIVVTRDAPAHAEAAVRSLLDRAQGLSDVVLLDHGSRASAVARMTLMISALRAEGQNVRLLHVERTKNPDQALLLAAQEASGQRVLVVDDQVEVLPEEAGFLSGLHWLLEERSACSVAPTLLLRHEAGVASRPGLPEQRRMPTLQRAAFLAERRTLLAALLSGEDLGGALRSVTGGGIPWAHGVRLVHATGEARRDGSPYAAAVDSPLPASIVVLAHDNLPLTRACLSALQAQTPAPYELVLVDNGSRDGTGAYFKSLQVQLGPATPVQLLANAHNLGFPAAANQGIRAARGRHVVVLNNDTIVQDGWLDALLDAADTDADVGVVTAKILNHDLTVQSAGGVLHAPDGSFTIPGQGLPRNAPEVTRRRLLSNAGGPCMLLTRGLLERVAPGGQPFDEAYSPGYFEDSDLCLRAREAGFALLYEPGAEVLHHGKATANLLASRGELDVWGRFEANKRRFHRRWAERLALDHARGAPARLLAGSPEADR